MGLSSTKMTTQAAVINASGKHTATVIFLHGLGDQGRSWADCFQALKQAHIKYIFPNAPTMPVTLNGGFRMPSWFDLHGLSPNSREDEEGIKSAAANIHELIKAEVNNGISRNRIVIGGFSQGGALSLYSAFGYNLPPIGGVLALSSWLPLHKTFDKLQGNTDTPLLQCHGKEDMMVNFVFGQETHNMLKTFNSKAEFKGYNHMGHHSSEEEMADVKLFLDRVLPKV